MPLVAMPPEVEYTPMAMVQPLVEGGIKQVPMRFIQPESQRPGLSVQQNSQIPVIDMSLLDDENHREQLSPKSLPLVKNGASSRYHLNPLRFSIPNTQCTI